MLAELDADVWFARAEESLARRDLTEALEQFNRAARVGGDPGRACGGRWMCAMLVGDFAAAWVESDMIRRLGLPDPHRFWMGEDLRGAHVMVRCLHGFGDALQMLRFAPRLAAMAASVTYEVAPRLVELARCIEGVENVITWGEHAPVVPPAWDVQVEVMELPYLLRILPGELWSAPYVHLREEVVTAAGVALVAGKGKRAGLVWASGGWNRERSLPFSLLKPLCTLDGWTMWNVQGGEERGEAAGWMQDATEAAGEGLLRMAATIANMDLVITVDTLAAHLAGAMGKPVWLLLQHMADWRWMTERNDSPWYPSIRIFRQPAQGDWVAVIEAVRRSLENGDAP